MININDIDITKRCGYKPTDTIHNFIEELTKEKVTDLIKSCIQWEKDGEFYAKGNIEKYSPYLNTPVKDIPEDILSGLYGLICTDNVKIYTYHSCCR